MLQKAPKISGKSTIGVVTKMTKKAWGLACFPGALAVYLLGMSFRYNSLFAMADGSRWVFVIGPLAAALLIVVAMVRVSRAYLGVKITLAPTHLALEPRDEKNHLQVAWKSLLYTQPSFGGKIVRALQVGSSEKSSTIYDIFTPGFDYLCKEVAKRKTYSISADSAGNMVIDSTRLGRV